MNILHMKYALEVARLGSLNKAAETLLIAQPNISRSIKELEASLGITIFNRSAKGMELTREGEEFIGYAKEILRQIDEMESLYKNGVQRRQRFSVSVPHSYYTCEAFAALAGSAEAQSADMYCHETTTHGTLDDVLERGYALGVVRYFAEQDTSFKQLLEDKGLVYELIGEFKHVLLVNRDCPLAAEKSISTAMLSQYAELTLSDVGTVSLAQKPSLEELGIYTARHIYVSDRESAYSLLCHTKDTFMWVSPVSRDLQERYGLVSLEVSDNQKRFKDMLIYRNGYRLSRLDNAFITALCDCRRKCF